MWTNDPFWLFMLKGLIERVRPTLNWILVTLLTAYSFFVWLICFNLTWWAFTRLSAPDTLLEGLEAVGRVLVAPLLPLPYLCIVPYGCILGLLLMNVKFSIRWRQ